MKMCPKINLGRSLNISVVRIKNNDTSWDLS